MKKQLTFLAGAGIGFWMLRRKLRSRRAIDLRGKLVLITGGSRGLGLELAREFSGEGAGVASSGCDEETLRRAAQELNSKGAIVNGYVCDVANAESVAELIARV